MNNDEIILVKPREEFLKAEKNKKRQNKKRIKSAVRLALLLFICLGIAGVCRHLPQIISTFENIFPNEQVQNEAQDTENGNNSQETIPEQSIKIPEGNYQILDTGPQKYTLTNESGCDIKPEDVTITTISETSKLYGSTAPLVLVTALHIRESYSNGKYYSPNDDFYCDENNVGELCEIIANKLCTLGINAISITELYASGSLFGSRTEYEKSLEGTLKKYPSISYVFDISRGTNIKDDLTMDKNTFNINGESAAQITLISGTGSNTLSENQRKNVHFALDFSEFSFDAAPYLVLENKISRFPISQNISPFVCEIQIGTYANSFDEAKTGALSFASLFSSYLLSKEPTL